MELLARAEALHEKKQIEECKATAEDQERGSWYIDSIKNQWWTN